MARKPAGSLSLLVDVIQTSRSSQEFLEKNCMKRAGSLAAALRLRRSYSTKQTCSSEQTIRTRAPREYANFASRLHVAEESSVWDSASRRSGRHTLTRKSWRTCTLT